MCFLTLGCINNLGPYFGLYQQCGSLIWALSTVWVLTLGCINSVVRYFGLYQQYGSFNTIYLSAEISH